MEVVLEGDNTSEILSVVVVLSTLDIFIIVQGHSIIITDGLSTYQYKYCGITIGPGLERFRGVEQAP